MCRRSGRALIQPLLVSADPYDDLHAVNFYPSPMLSLRQFTYSKSGVTLCQPHDNRPPFEVSR